MEIKKGIFYSDYTAVFYQWLVDVHRDESHTRNGGNKLRTYRSFNQQFQLENYCKTVFRSDGSLNENQFSQCC